MLTRCSIVALLALAGQAMGQSFNVDLNNASGAGSGAPATTFAGTLGQTGTWNAITPGSSGVVTLVNLNGTVSGVTLTKSGNGSASSASVSGATTDYGRLFWDYSMGFTQSGNNQVTLNGMAPGLYRVAVYAYLPGAEGQYDSGGFLTNHINYLSVSVGGTAAGSGSTSGATAVNTYEEGKTHKLFTINVPAGAPAVQVRSYCDLGNGLAKAALNGIQVMKYDSNRLYVDKDAVAGLNTGKSWTDAFVDLQDALRLARESNGFITEIWVAEGVYKPTATTDRTKSFVLVNGCALIGGFAGTETSVNQRNIAGHTTWLSGDIGVARNASDNSYSVISAVGSSATTVLDGFAVTGGNASGSGVNGVGDRGGAMALNNASPTVRNCSFQSNSASVFGGGVYVLNGSPTFRSCTFASNSCAWQGGAIRHEKSSEFPGEPNILMVNCRLFGNTSGEYGGAIQSNGGDIALANCALYNNMATGRGGAIASTGSTSQIRLWQCTVTGNTSGGVVSGLHASHSSSIEVRNSIVWGNGNWSGTTEFGGTFSSLYSLIQNNPIVANSGCIYGNPLFTNPLGVDGFAGSADDDFTPQAASPVVDAGSVSNIPLDWLDLNGNGITISETVPFDLLGNARRVDVAGKVDTGIGGAPLPDMGAFETPDVPACPADWDNDGDADSDDVVAFFTAWDSGEADFDGDADTDSDDIIGFFSTWDAGC